MPDVHFYEPALGHGLRYNPLNAMVAPRPIGWIATRDAAGRANLAPYSFFNAFCYEPPIIGFSSTAPKDTWSNVAQTGEFTWNLVTRELAERMNATSATVPPGVDEFELAGLTKGPSRKVSVPRVAESRVSSECVRTQQLRLTGADGAPARAWVTFGEVVGVHIDRALIRDGVYQTADAHPVLRAGRLGDYVEVRPDAVFSMRRPD